MQGFARPFPKGICPNNKKMKRKQSRFVEIRWRREKIKRPSYIPLPEKLRKVERVEPKVARENQSLINPADESKIAMTRSRDSIHHLVCFLQPRGQPSNDFRTAKAGIGKNKSRKKKQNLEGKSRES